VRVLVIGLNPAFGSDEAIPRLNCDLGTYIDWYSNRLLATVGAIHWAVQLIGTWMAFKPRRLFCRAVERDYSINGLGSASFGNRAVYLDAIPWMWNKWGASRSY